MAVKGNLAMDSENVIGEDGAVFTAEYFGCIYWREKESTLIDLDKTVDVKKILEDKRRREDGE